LREWVLIGPDSARFGTREAASLEQLATGTCEVSDFKCNKLPKQEDGKARTAQKRRSRANSFAERVVRQTAVSESGGSQNRQGTTRVTADPAVKPSGEGIATTAAGKLRKGSATAED